MAVVVLTGSSGFIGATAVRRLSAAYTVAGFDREGDPHPPPEAECVCVDLTSDESVRFALARLRHAYGNRIASVIHLAAYYDFSGAQSPKYEQVTVRGTERLLRGLQDFDVEQFIFTSTMLVHAPTRPGEPINEDWPLQPKWAYPKSKVKTEDLIRSHRGRIPALILRLAGVYDDDCHSIPLANQIQRIYEKRVTGRVFPGDLSHGQSFLHLDDVVDLLAAAVQRRGQLPPEQTLLAGEPKTLGYDGLQRSFASLIHGEDWETNEIPKEVAKAGAWLQDALPGAKPFIKPWMVDIADDHYELDISRARDLLGWQPRHSLRETLPKMVDSLKADPAAWYKRNKLKPPSSLKGPEQKRETGQG